MRFIGAALLLVLAACNAPAASGSTETPAPTRVAGATITPMTLSTEAPRHMKSAGQVFAVVDPQTLWVRVDQGNVNLQVALNGALLALRADANTTYAKVTVGLAGVADLRAGDHITFAFDPGTRDARGAYLATVIGR
jgi:hypothetical protein